MIYDNNMSCQIDKCQVICSNKNMIDRKLLNELYKKEHSYAQIGRIFNVSRQRIHQILKNYKGKINKKTKKGLSKLCNICHETAKAIHHIDKIHNNNDPKNLLSVCLKCHYELHRGERIYKEFICKYCNKIFNKSEFNNKLYKYCSHECYNTYRDKYCKYKNIKNRFGYWNLKYDDCIICHQTDRKHVALGLCRRCYARIKAREKKSKSAI